MPGPVTLLVVYLSLTAVLIPLGGTSPVRLFVLLAHLATTVALTTTPSWRDRAPALRVLADWMPLFIVPVLYLELPILMEGLPGPVHYHDPLIAGLERSLFGFEPAYAWAGAWPIRALSEALHACYFSYYPLVYTPPLLVYLGVSRITGGTSGLGTTERVDLGDGERWALPPERRAAFDETMLAIVLSFLACYLVFVVFPVQGPRYLGVPAGVPDGPVRRLVLRVLEGASSRGAAFPSSHVSLAVTQALMARRFQRRVGVWTSVIAVGLAAGAVYGGFHYGVDALAGALVGVAAAACARPLARRLEGPPPGFTWTPKAV